MATASVSWRTLIIKKRLKNAQRKWLASRCVIFLFVLLVSLAIASQGVHAARELVETTKL
uniref:Uncharacterized protein n=1 Tax=Oryza sativa subsp. japonica TaxID=39947 RepID=Q5Z4B5_ORYSJ|nr:hypothetical protein [Oryza sativa Japonica Group]BAD62417.1 hypothetical protein [Oryza sativa Japonica Group]